MPGLPLLTYPSTQWAPLTIVSVPWPVLQRFAWSLPIPHYTSSPGNKTYLQWLDYLPSLHPILAWCLFSLPYLLWILIPPSKWHGNSDHFGYLTVSSEKGCLRMCLCWKSGGGGKMVKTCYPSAVLRVFRGWEFPGLGSIPSWGTKSLQAQASRCDQKKK